jgi:hypothetical protein
LRGERLGGEALSGYEVEVRVVDEESGLREAVVKVRGKVVAVIPLRDEYSLKRILEGSTSSTPCRGFARPSTSSTLIPQIWGMTKA